MLIDDDLDDSVSVKCGSLVNLKCVAADVQVVVGCFPVAGDAGVLHDHTLGD